MCLGFLEKNFFKEISGAPQWVFNRRVRKVTKKAVSAVREVFLVVNEPIKLIMS